MRRGLAPLLLLTASLYAASASAGEQIVALDLQSLEDLAARADALIDDCRDGTVECWNTDARLALARAYLVRVTHRRVVLGHNDQQGAANARYLAPHVSRTWSEALPEDDGTVPEDWLFALELQAMAAERAADREEDELDGGAPAYELPDEAAPDAAVIDLDLDLGYHPLGVRGSFSVVGRLGARPGPVQPGTTLTGGPELSPEVAAFGHAVLGRRGLVRGGLEYRYVHLNAPGEIERLTNVSPEEQTQTGRGALLATHGTRVEAGGGVRVGGLQRHEAQLWAAIGASWGGFTTETNRHLWDDYGHLAAPGYAGLGPRLGVTTTHVLGPEARWAVVWSVSATAEKRWTHRRYADPALPFDFPRAGEDALFPDELTRDDTTADRITVDADLLLRFRAGGGVAIEVGPAFRLLTELESEDASAAWFGTRVPVAQTAAFVMPRVGVTMLLR